ncbi:gamma-glutamyltransferase family protein [Comamonas sp. B-9]|uniref:gamma-glutamyltransferase family protein n=1 Tax=Comamonas sp. B-9 TaxID=1055192 RepID=UPI000415B6E2|nr:gamma-glutamyltransferase family protein [Comamonas sp. B-9]
MPRLSPGSRTRRPHLPPSRTTASRWSPSLAAVATAALLAACSSQPQLQYQPPMASDQPEGSSGWTDKPGWATEQYAVAAANPLATDAGYQVLQAGGSAIDAAIAVQLVLGLVEPQSSGIGGGAFLLHAQGSQVEAYDGREVAPMAADENLFMRDGKPMAFHDAVVGGRSVGVPGAIRMLEMAHKEHGKLPWASLFEPAIRLATDGFKVSARVNALTAQEKFLGQDPVASGYFLDAHGKPWPVGHLLKNPEYAAVLQGIAQHGSKALLEGPVAEAIVRKVQGHASNPGKLSLADLAAYQPLKRQALCSDYSPSAAGAPASQPASTRSYRLCGFPPPSSGGIAVAQILGILANTPAGQMGLGADGLPSADWLHLYAEASRLAFADRNQYVADPAFVGAPAGDWSSMLRPDYLAQRARLIGARSMQQAQPGRPGSVQMAYASQPYQQEYGTSHISIVDRYGNAIAMTTTIEDQFGSRQMVNTGRGLAGGFLLNNELTDFSLAPRDAQGQPIANRVEPGKRPRSSMAPTLVFDKATDRLVISAGSPGGAWIIHYTTKTLYGMLNWGLMPQQAINLPNFGSLNGPTVLEEKRFPAATVQALQARGAEVKEQNLTSGLQAISRGEAHGKSWWFGGADPRREGIVMGQ